MGPARCHGHGPRFLFLDAVALGRAGLLGVVRLWWVGIAQAERLWPDQDTARLGLPVRQRARTRDMEIQQHRQAGQVMRLGAFWERDSIR